MPEDVEEAVALEDVLPEVAGAITGGVLRVARGLAAVMTVLFAASMVAAGRWPLLALRRVLVSTRARFALDRTMLNAREAIGSVVENFAEKRHAWQRAYEGGMPDDLINAFNIVSTRISLVELRILELSPDLLLRDVLLSEVSILRKRLAEAERLSPRRTPTKTAAIVRTMLAELDRIKRISESGSQSFQNAAQSEAEMPKSFGDAYRVLGINADAAPFVAKKLVDALRMSWHPDHARDESDRMRREDRIKQINAAWDIINGRREAA